MEEIKGNRDFQFGCAFPIIFTRKIVISLYAICILKKKYNKKEKKILLDDVFVL